MAETFFPFKNGIPKHDTIVRVLSRLAANALQSSLISWINDACKLTDGEVIAIDGEVIAIDGEVIAIDGKTVRRSFKNGERKSAIHMVSAWASQNNLILGQRKVDNKSNEITAIPALLELLDLKAYIITIDAKGCQTAIAETIIKQGADYILALKGNQGTLSDEVNHLFDQATLPQLKQQHYEEIDTGHGRNEKRCCRQIEIDREHLPESYRWPQLNTIIEIEAVRQHWSVENKLHWVLDVTFREDESRIRRDNGAEVMSTLRRITLNLLKNNTTSKASLNRKRKIAALDEQFISELIKGI